MSGVQIRQVGAAVLLVVLWAAASPGAAKGHNPNAVAGPSGPPSTAQAAKSQHLPVKLENPATFSTNMSFARAIEILRHSTYPPLNIVVLWRNVEEKAGVTRETPIGFDGVPGLRIRQYLELLLRSVSAGSDAELGYALDGGVIVVATKDALPKQKMETRVYDISDLVAPPSIGIAWLPTAPMMSSLGGGGFMQSYGGYGTGSPFHSYSSLMGRNSVGSQPGTTNVQRATPGRAVVGGS
jgi:hypothetical protein